MNELAQHLPALQVIVPMLAAPVLALLAPRGLAWAATTIVSLMSFLIALQLTLLVLGGAMPTYLMGSWPAPFGIELRIDELSVLLLLMLTGASTVALIGGRKSVDYEISEQRQPLFYSAWALALAGLAGIVVSADAFNVFVFMEISSLASYVLIAGGPDRRALPAVFKYLIMGTVGATFYLIGIGLIYLMTGTLNLADMELRIHDVADQRPILVAAGFITVGLALKAAVFPLHVWLPNAYTYAPNMVTVFLAACATKVSIYVLLRFDFFVFQQNLTQHDVQFAAFLMPLAAAAIIVGSLVAVFEKNIKRLLAFSSVAQVGYILLGASLVSVAGLTASLLHMFNHALAKGALFMAVACLATRLNGLRLEDLRGAARTMPWTTAALVLAALSLIGIPGTAGFISKWYLISALLTNGLIGVALILVVIIGSLLAVIYIWRIVESLRSLEAPGQTQQKEAPALLLVMTLAAAGANIWFGFVPDLPLELAQRSAAALLVHLP